MPWIENMRGDSGEASVCNGRSYVKVSELLQRFRDETRYITELIDALLTVDTLYKQQEVQS